jgi:hypothetical protein
MHDSEDGKAKPDRTFDPLSEYGSNAWCGAVLGKTTDWFRKNRVTLEADGFPKVCRLVGLTVKADVRAWISKRRRYADMAVKDQAPTMAKNKERLDRF